MLVFLSSTDNSFMGFGALERRRLFGSFDRSAYELNLNHSSKVT